MDMDIPPPDLSWFTERFLAAARELADNWSESAQQPASDEAPPELLIDAMCQLIDLLRSHDSELAPTDPEPSAATGPGISELGEYGISMLDEFARLHVELGMGEPVTWERLSLSMARWVVEHEGEIDSPQLAVNALARIANQNGNLGVLESLHAIMCEMIESTAPPDESGPVADSPLSQAFRMLLVNRAIVATRTLSPLCMEQAFDAIVQHFPEQAPQFFAEGEIEVHKRGYPQEVAEVIVRYANAWPLPRTLH